MTIRNVTTTLAGVVMLMASTTAVGIIWLLLTAPTTVATTVDGRAVGALQLIVQAVVAVVSRIVQYL